MADDHTRPRYLAGPIPTVRTDPPVDGPGGGACWAAPEARESLRQLRLVWRAMVLDSRSGADVRDPRGISVRWAESGFPFWNAVALTEDGLDPRRLELRLDEVAEVMRGKERQGYLWVFEDLLDTAARRALPELAERAGLVHAMSGVGMAGDILPVPEPAHPRLTFERVTTEDQLMAFADINSAAHGFAPDGVRTAFAGSSFWKTGVHAYLGSEDGRPVTAAATVPCEGRLFALLVATLPGSERQGFGEAVTRQALHEGGRSGGLSRATLHATAVSAPVYPRIGFRPHSPIHWYTVAS